MSCHGRVLEQATRHARQSVLFRAPHSCLTQPTRTDETGFGPFASAVVLGMPRAIALRMLGGIGLVVCPLIVASAIVELLSWRCSVMAHRFIVSLNQSGRTPSAHSPPR